MITSLYREGRPFGSSSPVLAEQARVSEGAIVSRLIYAVALRVSFVIKRFHGIMQALPAVVEKRGVCMWKALKGVSAGSSSYHTLRRTDRTTGMCSFRVPVALDAGEECHQMLN